MPQTPDHLHAERGQFSLYFPISAFAVERVVRQVKSNGVRVIQEEYMSWGKKDPIAELLIQTGLKAYTFEANQVVAGAYRTGHAFSQRMLKEQAKLNMVSLPPLTQEALNAYFQDCYKKYGDDRTLREIIRLGLQELRPQEPHFMGGIDELSTIGFAQFAPEAFQLGAMETYRSRRLQIASGK